jgi:hypothetical protein
VQGGGPDRGGRHRGREQQQRYGAH